MNYLKHSKNENIEGIISKIKEEANSLNAESPMHSLLSVKTANECVRDSGNKEDPKMLFDSFWREGEICVLFADTNLGKSILAVQIADSITKGKAIKGFAFDAKKQKALLIDFELSEKQFGSRYTEKGRFYNFDESLLRVSMNTNCDLDIVDSNFEDTLVQEIEALIVRHESKIVIIDNITYMATDTQKGILAKQLMQRLKLMKEKYSLSILIVAHTPKIYNVKALDINMVQGSKNISNFIDSCFGIGRSKVGDNYRYIKQIKVRTGETKYGETNVCHMEIRKDDAFLELRLLEHKTERSLLPVGLQRDEMEAQMKEMHAQGTKNVEIANYFGVNSMFVSRALKKSDAISHLNTVEYNS
jgi:KaiC/GvpD/RAD55 family RecA-like ATPase